MSTGRAPERGRINDTYSDMSKAPSHSRLSPLEVQKSFDLLRIPSRFTKTEIERLNTDDVLVQEGFLTFPTPEDNSALSILNLRRALGTDPSREPVFYDHPWYLEDAFGYLRCDPGWHSVRMEVTADSISQPVYYADSIKSFGLFLPSAIEVALMLFLTFNLTGKRLLVNKHSWTKDRAENKRFVTVGAFGKKGLFVSSHEVGYASRGLGICPTVDPIADRGTT